MLGELVLPSWWDRWQSEHRADQVLFCVISQSAPRLTVMDLKIFRSPAGIGNASRPAPVLRGRAGDKPQALASSVAVWIRITVKGLT